MVVIDGTTHEPYLYFTDRALAVLFLIQFYESLRCYALASTSPIQSPRLFILILFDSLLVFLNPTSVRLIEATVALAFE
jgi:hypothetical protein